MRLGEAQTPDGMRIYAIGDIHGCDTMLADMHQRIAADLAARPVGDHRIIHIGDYIDRGPDSAAVIRRLAAMIFADPRVICLRGNHDQMLLDFLADPEAGGSMFLGNGGKQTLRSFGVSLRSQNYAGLARRLAEAMSRRSARSRSTCASWSASATLSSSMPASGRACPWSSRTNTT